MGTVGHIELSIPVIWHYTSEVRQAVDSVMQGHAGPLRQATQMVASELVENALKYGQATPEIQQIRFSLWLNEQEIVIEVTNGVCDRAALAEFEARDGEVTAATPIRRRVPVDDYLRPQKRFAHLYVGDGRPDLVARIQAEADRNIRRYRLCPDEVTS